MLKLAECAGIAVLGVSVVGVPFPTPALLLASLWLRDECEEHPKRGPVRLKRWHAALTSDDLPAARRRKFTPGLAEAEAGAATLLLQVCEACPHPCEDRLKDSI